MHRPQVRLPVGMDDGGGGASKRVFNGNWLRGAAGLVVARVVRNDQPCRVDLLDRGNVVDAGCFGQLRLDVRSFDCGQVSRPALARQQLGHRSRKACEDRRRVHLVALVQLHHELLRRHGMRRGSSRRRGSEKDDPCQYADAGEPGTQRPPPQDLRQ